MKPFCFSRDPVDGEIDSGNPSSFIARVSAAFDGSVP
jgi:hypothetical protein